VLNPSVNIFSIHQGDTVNSLVNVNCHFDQLEEIWLGDTYPEEYYNDLDSKVKDVFKKITDITKTDLLKIEQVFTELGVKVRRPKWSANANDYKDNNGILYRPPVPCRDTHLSLGSDFFHVQSPYPVDPWQEILDEYEQSGAKVYNRGFLSEFGYIHPPSIVRLGKDIIIDIDTHQHSWHLMEQDFIPYLIDKGHRVLVCDTGGHVDSVFTVPKEGKIIAAHWKTNYEAELPGWEVHRIPDEQVSDKNYQNVSFNKAWWVNEVQEHASIQVPKFNDYLIKNAIDWIGFPVETVFSVNSVVINEDLIITTGEPPAETKLWLKENKIDYIPIDFRCCHFWDSGIHCLTVDIRRNGPVRDFFPDRTENIYRFYNEE